MAAAAAIVLVLVVMGCRAGCRHVDLRFIRYTVDGPPAMEL